jgi:type IV secretory pathway TraG/TraD family ATPase VirD4
MGSIGSGKTLMMQTLMSSVLSHATPGVNRRAIIFDPKGDAVRYLQRDGFSCPIFNMNPFNANSFAWDMAVDIRNTVAAEDCAALLVQAKEDSDEGVFFTLAARQLLRGVLLAFIGRNEHWTLRDLIIATTNKDRLRDVLLSHPRGSDLVKQYCLPEVTFQNVFVRLSQATMMCDEIAVVWERTPKDRQLSIREWIKADASILQLGGRSTREPQLAVINQILLQNACQAVLTGEESPREWKTWIFFDGIQDLPKIPRLPELLSYGRSKGIRVAFSTQDIEAIRRIYDDDPGNEIMSSCSNHSILRLNDSMTAEWASQLTSTTTTFEYHPKNAALQFGDVEVIRDFKTDPSFRPRPSYMPSEFMDFPLSENGRVVGCHMIQALGGAVRRETLHSLI